MSHNSLELSPRSQGCQTQDHLISVDEMEDGSMKTNKVYDDLLAYRHVIAAPVKPEKSSSL